MLTLSRLPAQKAYQAVSSEHEQTSRLSSQTSNLSLSQSVISIYFKVTELNEYCPIAHSSSIVKCFKRLVKDHITSNFPDSLDLLQFAYRPNKSIAPHSTLSHLDKRNSYCM